MKQARDPGPLLLIGRQKGLAGLHDFESNEILEHRLAMFGNKQQ